MALAADFGVQRQSATMWIRMKKKAQSLNPVFAAAMALLATWALAFVYYDSGHRSTINPAAKLPPDHPPLPENHPPIDSARELLALEQLSRSNPTNAEYKNRIANTYYDMGQYQKAIEAYQQSLALHPQDPSVETDMATSYHYLGAHDRALEILDRVLGYSPNFPQAMLNKGVVLYAGKNQVEPAIATWEALLRAHPDLPQRADLEARIQQLKSGRR